MTQSYNIDSVAYGGKGVTRVDGKVLFINDTLPGDVVTARVTKNKKRYAELEVIKRVTDSPLRQPKKCKFSEACGGCQWLDVSLAQQVYWKEEILRSTLSRCGFKDQKMAIEVFSHDDYKNALRSRLRVHGHIMGGVLEWGFLQRRSHKLIPIDNCIVASLTIQSFLKSWENRVFEGFKSAETFAFQIEVQEICGTSFDPQVLVTFLTGKPSFDVRLAKVISYCKSLSSVAFAGLKKETVNAPYFLLEHHLGIDYFVKPGHFVQSNFILNRRLREAVQSFVNDCRVNRILDAYCGSGNLSLPLHKQGREVVGIESHGDAIKAARYSFEKNHLPGECHYFAGDIATELDHFIKRREYFDFIILDPPRAGLMAVVDKIKALKPQFIVLVGCEPNHFARDLKSLSDFGYEIKKLILADFFPATYHLESIAFLAHKNP